MLFVSCGGKEPVDPTPVETKDTKAPVISVSLSSVNVIGGQEVTLGTSELKIGEKTVATWKDDVSKTCKAALEFNGQTISSGSKLSEPGKLKLSVTDEAGNTAAAEITLTNEDTQAPQISVVISEKNVIAGVKVSIQDNQLLFDDSVAATWTDDYSETFTVELSLIVDGCEPESINPGDLITKAGVLKIHVSDEFQNKTIAEITLTAVAITGLENLQNLTFQVDQEVNLLQGLTIADGLTLSKVEVEQDGVRSEIPNPQAYIPEFPGTVNIILTFARPDGSTIEVKVDKLTVNALAYNKMTVTDIKPVDILPIIGQIEIGDKNVYSYIEHLKVAEATRIRDMMWEYGAGPHSRVDYQELMSRLHT